MRRLVGVVLALTLGCSTPPTAPSPAPAAAPAPSSPSPAPASAPAPSSAPSPSLSTSTSTPPTPQTGSSLFALPSPAPTLDGVLDDPAWQSASPIAIDRTYADAPYTALETTVRLAYAPDALFVAFDGTYDGEIDLPDGPADLEQEHLYGHDALEIFVDADPSSPNTYREIELGPGGHFLDVDVDRDRRPRGDVAWSSGVTLASHVDPATHRFAIEARVPSSTLGDVPLAPSTLRIGLFRIGRANGERCFLARFPTLTERPNFHVPERFGTLELRP